MWGVSPPHPKPPETYMCDDRLYYTKVKTIDTFYMMYLENINAVGEKPRRAQVHDNVMYILRYEVATFY